MSNWIPKEVPRVCHTKTEWTKVPANVNIVPVGKQAVMFGCGVHLTFFDLATNDSNVHRTEGDGIGAYDGFAALPVFAYAERRPNPNVYVIRYPTFDTINVLQNGSPYEYRDMSFSTGDYLVTFSGEPFPMITVWNWRTGDNICKYETNFSGKQMVKCSYSVPTTVAHFTEKQLAVLDVYNYYKKFNIVPRQLLLDSDIDGILDVEWSPEGNIFILATSGDVYVGSETVQLNFNLIIKGRNNAIERPVFIWYSNGILVKHPNREISHYVKNENAWTEEWTISTEISVYAFLKNTINGSLYAWTKDGWVKEFVQENAEWKELSCFLSDLIDFEIIYPLCECFVSFSSSNELKCWKLATGDHLNSLQFEEVICSIGANPLLPYVCLGMEKGLVVMVSALEDSAMKVMARFVLMDYDVEAISYTAAGDSVIAANKSYGMFFVIRGRPGQQMKIIGYFDYRRTILDFAVNESATNIFVCMLVLKTPGIAGTNKIVMEIVSKIDGRVRKKHITMDRFQSTMELTGLPMNLSSLMDTFFAQNESSMVFISNKVSTYNKIAIVGEAIYMVPTQSKMVRKTELCQKKIRVRHQFSTGHLLRGITIHTRPNHFLTHGPDGLVTVRSYDTTHLWAVCLAHHRSADGVQKARLTSDLRRVLSLGADGSLVCIELTTMPRSEEQLLLIRAEYNRARPLFEKTTIGFEPVRGYEGTNYIQIQKLVQTEIDTACAATTRQQLEDTFAKIKEEGCKLLDDNNERPEMERIDILDFYIHGRMREHLERQTEFECEWLRRHAQLTIEAQDEVASWLKRQFWDTTLVRRSKLFGIGANVEVENYVQITPSHTDFENILIMREIEELLRKGDTFLPWIPATDETTQNHLARTPDIHRTDEGDRIRQALEVADDDDDDDDDDDVDDEEESIDTTQARLQQFPAATTVDYIGRNRWFYQQAETHSFEQRRRQTVMLHHQDSEIRGHFNRRFDELMSAKAREMNVIQERNRRLRYVLDELRWLGHDNADIAVDDPKWSQLEKPDMLIRVETNEVPTPPYVSPEMQRLLDERAAEEERIRLALLADDFRERALFDMMWGVLEILWEDTIKIDVPKPKCMLEKQPEEFDENDLRLVFEYEEKVKFLMGERLRYRNMLEAEYGKLAEATREGVRKFNQRLRDLLVVKLQVEMARLEEKLNIQRLNRKMYRKEVRFRRHEELQAQIAENEHLTANTLDRIAEMTEAATECRNVGEQLFAKDKQFEKHFNREFAELSQLTQAQANKLYKKMPRASVRGVPSATLLNELGHCCVAHERSLILTTECVDFLRSLDQLDQYVGVPATIDEHLYQVICRHRRIRIENELRTRANAIEQLEIDATVVALQKHLAERRERTQQLEAQLAKHRAEILRLIHDNEIQIVVQQGFVEIDLNGRFEDFDNAIVVNRSEIENINAVILKAGERKLKVMNDKMIHRRSILLKEWHHQTLSMHIEDLETKLRTVRNIKVTKEIQTYLKNRAKGYAADKGVLVLDQEIEIIRKSYERIIFERKHKVDDLQAKIQEYRKKNKALDAEISKINIDICELHLNRNLEFEQQEKRSNKIRMDAVVKRNKLVERIQRQHNEILMLQTELELMRLKTYPTLKFKTID